MKFPPENLTGSLLEESCIFEVPSDVFIEFPYIRRSSVIVHAQSDRNLAEADCAATVTYLATGQNVLCERMVEPKFAKYTAISPSAVVTERMGVSAATTISVGIEAVAGAVSIVVQLRRTSSAPLFIRRDTIRIAKTRKPESFLPDCAVLLVSEQSRPRYLAKCEPGRHVLSSRFSIGAKGLMLTMTPFRLSGVRVRRKIGYIAFLDSGDVGAIPIPRARRLERPDRFNKVIYVPAMAHFFAGELYPLSEQDVCFYDIYSLRLRRTRKSIGLPTGVNVFERVALDLHQAALERSRGDFMALMQHE